MGTWYVIFGQCGMGFDPETTNIEENLSFGFWHIDWIAEIEQHDYA